MKDNLCRNEMKIKIGPEAIKFKTGNEEDEGGFPFSIEGTICQVGLNFVDLLQDNNSVITILTDKITDISWDDPECQKINTGCIGDHSKCEQSECCTECKDRQGLRQQQKMNTHNRICQTCHLISCQCDDNLGYIHSDSTMRSKKRNRFNKSASKVCPHCSSEYMMKQDHCPVCHKNDIANNHQHDICHQRITCFFDHPIPFCDDRIELRLAGLTDDINFKLLQHKGCRVKIGVN